MIDVNKITSTLAKLPDAQLQQYAQMHKNDPYIMALAMSESNRRKELRDAAPAQQGMQEQPKVVDQMVAEMAPQQMPEEMGIGRLPAGNMNFANGGIIAFAGGGDVERYNGAQTSLVGEAQRILQKPPYARTPQENAVLEKAGYALQRRTITPDSGVAQADLFLNNLGPKIRNYFTEGASGLSDEALANRPNTGGVMNERLLRSMGVDPTAPRTAPVQSSPVTGAAADVESIRKASASPYVTPAAPTDEAAALLQRYPKPRTGEAAPKPDTGRKAPAAGPRTAATQPVDEGPQGLEALQQKYFGPLDQEVGVLRNQRAGLAADYTAMGKELEEATNKRIAERGDVYKGREERLAKREGELEGMGSKYAGLALLQAGAAMMSTPGGIGMALGKGVQVGSERYAAGIEKINAAKEKFAEARERLDDLRINRDDMNARDKETARREAKKLEMQGRELIHNGAVQDLGMKEKQVTAVFGAAANALNTDKEIAARKQIAAAQIKASLNTPDRALWDQLMAKNGNDAVKALEAFKLAKGDKFDVRSSYADYLKAFAGKEGLTPPMSMGAYAGQFGATLPR